tara:strand:+ start:1243 stop:8826 length:7584 start_codon:yes stop_codon:yes gene_type:complete
MSRFALLMSLVLGVPGVGYSKMLWNDDSHRVLGGDYNSDGIPDLYFDPTETIAVVSLDDLVLPLSLKAEEVVLGGEEGGVFRIDRNYVKQIIESTSWGESSYKKYVGLFNDDGYPDYFLQAQFPDQNSFILISPTPSTDAYISQYLNSENVGFDISSTNNDLVLRLGSSGDVEALVFIGRDTGNSKEIELSDFGIALLNGQIGEDGVASLESYAPIPESVNMLNFSENEEYDDTLYASQNLSTGVADDELVVGTIPGELIIDPSGASNYSMPISLPDGTNGMSPKLGLVYSSSTEFSNAGLGWNLSGLMQISRCYSESKKTTSFDSESEYCLDGNKLIPVGDYKGGVEYRTEEETFSRIVLYGDISNPDYWVEYRKSGEIVRYGDFPDGSDSNANVPTNFSVVSDEKLGRYSAWAVKLVEDRHGNYIRYNYLSDEGVHLLLSVEYTGNNITGLSPYNSVSFEYFSDGVRELKLYSPSSLGGEYRSSDRILKRVKLYSQGYLVSSYELGYERSSIRGREFLLTEVANCSYVNGDRQCLTPTKFDYHDGGNASGSNYESVAQLPASSSSKYYESPMFVDLDGDGDSELVRVYGESGSGLKIETFDGSDSGYTNEIASANVGMTATFSQSSSARQYDFIPYDYDGDGVQDLLEISSNSNTARFRFWRYEDNNFVLKSTSSRDLGGRLFPVANGLQSGYVYFEVTDFDGDTKLDLIAVQRLTKVNTNSSGNFSNAIASYRAILLRNNGVNGFTLAANKELARETVSSQSRLKDLEIVDKVQIFTMDADADGATDLVITDPRSISVDQYYISYRVLSFEGTVGLTESSAFASGDVFSFGVYSSERFVPLDFNGDGLLDLLQLSVQYTDQVDFEGRVRVLMYPSIWYNTTDKFRRERINIGLAQYTPDISDWLSNFQFFAADINDDNHQDLIVSYIGYESRDESDQSLLYGSRTVQAYDLWNRDLSGTTIGVVSYNSFEGRNSVRTFLNDIDGDGYQDLIKIWPSSDNGTSKTRISRAYKNNYTPRYLKSVENGLGFQSQIEYSTLTSDVYTPEQTNDQNLIDSVFPLFVVSKVTTSSATGSDREEAGVLVNIPEEDDGMERRYHYAGLKIHKGTVGNLGFREVSTIEEVVDSVGKITWRRTAKSIFSQDYISKNQGQLEQYQLWFEDISGEYLMEETVNDWRTLELPYGRRFSFPKIVDERKWDTNGQLVSQSSKEQTLDLEAGGTSLFDSANVVRVVVTVGLGLDSLVTTTVNNYGQENAEEWLVGKVTSTTVTKAMSVLTEIDGPRESVITRRSEWGYYQDSGEVWYEITEPQTAGGNDPKWKKSEYFYFSNGQLRKKETSGVGVVNVEINYLYDEFYRWVERTENVYPSGFNYAESIVRHPVAGYVLAKIDRNLLRVDYRYDAFGRVQLEQRYDGTSVSYVREKITNSFSSYSLETSSSDGSWSKQYYDKKGRVFHQQVLGALGQVAMEDIVYDAIGRIVKKSTPYFDGDSPSWTENLRFDVYDIPWLSPGVRSRKFYERDGRAAKFTVRIQNEQGNTSGYFRSITKEEVYDGFGNVVRYIDAEGNELVKKYDADGNPIEIKDLSAVVPFVTTDGSYTKTTDFPTTSIQYDLYGHKTRMDDPDVGVWSYYHSPDGRLIFQEDANGTKSCLAYDEQGKLILHIDNYKGTLQQAKNSCAGYSPSDLTATKSEWMYDTAQLGNTGNQYLGALHRELGDYDPVTQTYRNIKEYKYDRYGRPYETREIVEGVAYVTSYTYYDRDDPSGSTGKLKDTIYPSGLRVTNRYNEFGSLIALQNENGVDYWRLEEVDVRNQPKNEYFKNGIRLTKGYEQSTGWVNSIVAGNLISSSAIIDDSYHFDGLGNLLWRQNNLSEMKENFKYDDLNRLSESYPLGVIDGYGYSNFQQYSYDSNGNLSQRYYRDYLLTSRYESYGVQWGRYQSYNEEYFYGTPSSACAVQFAGPHAVTQVGSEIYCYDNNGNLVSGGGRTIEYNYRGKPTRIVKGQASTALRYDANNNRYKRVDEINGVRQSTLYFDGYERVSTPSGLEERHYIGGYVIVSIKNNAQRSERYMLRDHLGSVVAFLDELGSLEKRVSFDPWGRKRSLYWDQIPDSDIYTIGLELYQLGLTKGYTGHEMLDPVGLIHMNGRVYDPKIGRFISADPIIGDSTDLQSYNRYAYVLNNPLSITDPSGYIFSKLFKGVKSLVKSTLKALEKSVKIFLDFTVGKPLREFKRVLVNVPIVQTFVQIAACAGPWAAAACLPVSMALGYLNGGFEGAVIGGMTSMFNIGGATLIGEISPGNVLLHGGLGGAMAVLRGGDFKAGFASGFFSSAVAGRFDTNSLSWNTVCASMVGGLSSKLSGGKFSNGALTGAFAYVYNHHQHSAQKAPTYEEKIKMIAAAYRESGLEFTQEDAVMALKTAMSNDSRALALINGAGDLSEAQMQLALETSVVMSYSGESIELIGESGLTPLKGARWAIKNAAGHDFDLMDIRENLNDNFTSFGFGLATRRAGTLYIARPQGMGKFHQLFDPNVQGL